MLFTKGIVKNDSAMSMDWEIVILNEISQKEQNIYDITYVWDLKYTIDELIQEAKTDSQT